MPTALITGASAGLGLALAQALAERDFHLIIDARDAGRLDQAAGQLATRTTVTAIAGDIADRDHRAALAAEVAHTGTLDLLAHNASTLGPTPLHPLAEVGTSEFSRVLAVNLLGPVALTAALLPALQAARASVLTVSSDAAVEHYPGWGAYGASKAALDHLQGTFAAELPDIAWYAIDPGDMRTEMHQSAFPGEDISDRPEPETVVPSLLRIIDSRPPSGRYRAAQFAAESPATRAQAEVRA